MTETGRTARSTERGAIYVEFLIAFMPVFIFFLGILQLSFLYTGQLAVEHAATVAARTAALALGAPEPGENAGKGDTSVRLDAQRQALVRKGVILSLAPFILDGSIDDLLIEYPASDVPDAPNAPMQTFAAMTETTSPLVRARVRAQIDCKIMIANHLVCGGLGGSLLNPTMWLHSESVFPVERTTYEPAAQCAMNADLQTSNL